MKGAFRHIDTTLLEPLSDFVKAWSSDMPIEHDYTSSIRGSWFTSPKQHGVEIVLFNLAFFFGIWFFLGRALRPGAVIDRQLKQAMAAASRTRSRFDLFLLVTLTASLMLTVYHKAQQNNLIFMLQPCHVSMLALITILWMPPVRRTPHIAFNVYLHTQWGTILAIAQPDLRDYSQFLEVENFWFEHFALLIVPMLVIYNNRLCVFPLSMDVALASFLFKALYHTLVLHAIALYTGKNLNYMLVPPPGPLERFGFLYRPVMYGFCCLLTIAVRYLLVELVLCIIPRRLRVEKGKAAVDAVGGSHFAQHAKQQ
ncbi:hypothetical protein RI367_001853 [Sorochytrium milnesiophthora]